MSSAATQRPSHRLPAASVAVALEAAMDAKDRWTGPHCETVRDLCARIGRAAGLPRHRREPLCLAASLHDVGKLLIPDAIVQKAGPLEPHELRTMQRHPDLGATLLRAVGLEDIADWVPHHHERFDGQGYPMGLAGAEIPLESRIIFVADAFEAMTADRPYARPRSAAEAVRELEHGSGKQFDPSCVAALLTVLEEPRLSLRQQSRDPDGNSTPDRLRRQRTQRRQLPLTA